MGERKTTCHPIIYPTDKRGSVKTGLRIGEEVEINLLHDSDNNIIGVNCPYKDGSLCNVPKDVFDKLDGNYERGHCLPQII